MKRKEGKGREDQGARRREGKRGEKVSDGGGARGERERVSGER